MGRLSLLLLACLAVLALNVAADEQDRMIQWNRTPKLGSLFSNACDECQIIIKRIVQVAKDPTKLAELKTLLSLLCRETSYEEECRLFVANIDRFLDRLLPYLQDAHSACQKLHICSNNKLEQFHRVGLLYAKKYLSKVDGARDLICEECQFAAHELLTLVDDKNYQREVKDFLSTEVCAHLGQYRGICDEGLESFLPDFFAELHDLLKDNKQFCVEIELCNTANRLTAVGDDSTNSVEEPTESRKVTKRVISHFLKH